MGIIEGALRAGELRVSPTAQLFIAESQADLEAAIAAAVAGNGDVILLPRGGITVTSTIVVNKSGVRIIAVDDGLNPLARGEFNALLADEAFTDGPVMQVTAPCSLEGIGFVSRDTEATFFGGAALLIGGAAPAGAFGVWVKGCRFPKWGLDNRIGLALAGGAAVADVLIEECTFEGVGANFDAGIYAQGAIQNLTIRRNHFRQCTAAVQFGAFAGGGGPHIFLHENIVEDGKLLDTQGNAGDGLIVGNWLETATDTASYDRSVSDLKIAGYNFSGNHYSE